MPLWDGLLKQVGAIRVETVEEMVDMLVALLRVKPPRGLNTCAIGNGGGASLLVTDELERAGFRLPPIPAEIREQLKRLIPLAGSMIRNPMDAAPLFGAEQSAIIAKYGIDGWEEGVKSLRYSRGDNGIGDFMGILDDWPDTDSFILHYSLDSTPGSIIDWAVGTGAAPIILASRNCRLPVVIVFHFITNEDAWIPSLKAQKLALDTGLPLFLSIRGAAKAIRRLTEFSEAHPDLVKSLWQDTASAP